MSAEKSPISLTAKVVLTVIEFACIASAMLIFFTSGNFILAGLLFVLGLAIPSYVVWRMRQEQQKRIG